MDRLTVIPALAAISLLTACGAPAGAPSAAPVASSAAAKPPSVASSAAPAASKPASPAASASAAPLTKLTVGGAPIVPRSGIDVGIARGYFRDENLDIDIVPLQSAPEQVPFL